MRYSYIKYFVILFLLVLIFSHCQPTISGWGDDEDIYVLADSTTWLETEDIIRKNLEVKIMTPQTETMFTVRKAELDKFKRYKNIVFIATLNSQGQVAQVIQSILSDEARAKVESGEVYVFAQKEKWASEQMILFLVGTDIESLKNKIDENGKYIFSIFDNYWNEISLKRMFYHKEQIDIEKQLLEKYSWMVRVQHDYNIFVENSDSNFVMLRRLLPERWLFVHWFDTDDPSIITQEWIIEKRDKLTKIFYENDYVEQKFEQPEYQEVDFLGRRASYIVGLWRNDEKMAGGPFRNYTFYDEKQGRIYMLDYAIFSPRLKHSKRSLLRQAEILLHTFKTKNEVSIENL